MSKKVLISGYIGFENYGDDAILSLLVRYLKVRKCDISAFSSNPERTEEVFGIKAVRYMGFYDIIGAIFATDVLVSGGGSLLQNTTSTLSMLYYIYIISLAKFFGKKVVIFAQGIGPINGKFMQWLARRTLKKCDLVLVRDIFSQRILQRWGITSKFVPDPVWDTPLPEYRPMGYIGVQLRPYRFLHPNLMPELASYIGKYFSDRKIKIFSLQTKQDAAMCYEFQHYLKTAWSGITSEVVIITEPNQLLEEFSHLEYLFAMRFHAVLVALKFGIKVLPMSYDVKVKNLADEFSIPYIEACEDPDFYSDIRDLKNYEENEYFSKKRSENFNWTLLDKYVI